MAVLVYSTCEREEVFDVQLNYFYKIVQQLPFKQNFFMKTPINFLGFIGEWCLEAFNYDFLSFAIAGSSTNHCNSPFLGAIN
jgi:hypothetical protein